MSFSKHWEVLPAASLAAAGLLAQYPADAYAGNKLAIRESSIARIQQSLE